ncbi:winged helix-turn-helix domain-containing protein [Amycolatopsis pithecellobii]|uniref:GntR family transcriptional regulator n=1 Tax=Amycolatopsis pithecellobii TaxID=664692 RepID=A0A6N7ZAL5_9PSEU|nr:winged helix-turn-helix domain-containing protein [Amycolatopsis pithecellobii]MTD58770.1 GntR family transcriptional regulator [Amycolatopsis pithecellobii]
MGDDTTAEDLPEFDASPDIPGYLYVRLADHLAELITRGQLERHERFPAEIQLAKNYGVSLGTARHATQVLRQRGLVETVKGKGTYVTYNIERPAHGDDHGTPGFALPGEPMPRAIAPRRGKPR